MLSPAASLAFTLLLPAVLSLICFQGQRNASVPLEDEPMDCLANSQSCIRTYDPLSETVTRACQISKCMKSGVVSEHAVCSENFGKRNGTEIEECCCYGDGCNGKEVGEPLKDLADGEWYASVPPLRCHQGFWITTAPLSAPPILCKPGARACMERFDRALNSVYHTCEFSACKDANFEPTSAPVCKNVSIGAHTIEACCCSTDGCNNRLGNSQSTVPERQSLASSVAERIERFYDEDAVSSERAFIRRVVEHVHDNIVRNYY